MSKETCIPGEVLAWLPDDKILYYYADVLVAIRLDETYPAVALNAR